MHQHLAMIHAEQTVASLHRSAERWRRAREVTGRPQRRLGFSPSLALRLPRAHADLRACAASPLGAARQAVRDSRNG